MRMGQVRRVPGIAGFEKRPITLSSCCARQAMRNRGRVQCSRPGPNPIAQRAIKIPQQNSGPSHHEPLA